MTEPTPHYCDCGCGGLTAIAVMNNAKRGYRKGLSFRFIGRHHAWKGDQAGYHAKHASLKLHFPKSGWCEMCSAESAGTEYALIHGRAVSRNRKDYWELCKSCHRMYDTGGERNRNAKLTEAAVRDIRRRYAAGRGEPIRRLAQEYGVSKMTVLRAAVRKTWRYLT